MNSFYKAAVVGLGRIGSSYPSNKNPRTHAGAYIKNKRVNLVAGVDPDKKARDKFQRKWGKNIAVFSSVKDMLSKIQPDIVSICVPNPLLINIIKNFLIKPPKFFFLEKPILENFVRSKNLVKFLNKVPVAVNYHRCWDPSHMLFFDHIKKLGIIISIHVVYNGGMFNNSSHIIALMIKNFGKISNIKKLNTQTHVLKNIDPSFSFVLDFECGIQAIFQGFDKIKYDLLELEIISNSGIYSIKSGGCRKRIEKPKKNAFYPNYNQLIDKKYSMPDGQIEGLVQAVENMINYLDGKEKKIQCDLTLALEVAKILTKIHRQFTKK